MASKLRRVWCDGCYDLVHFGHANQWRQAKQLGDYLVVGVHSDKDIEEQKGPVIMGQEERCQMIRAMKWVDEVVPNAPYTTSAESLDRHGCDICVHGEDITRTNDGTDTYADAKAAGRFRACDRTPGISTADLIQRILRSAQPGKHPEEGTLNNPSKPSFLPSARMIAQFASTEDPRPNGVVVYVAGAFDLFHAGHLAFLEEAKKLGDYLIVGVHTDEDANAYGGDKRPIMTLHERVLNVLSYKLVSDVVIGAPAVVTQEFIERFGIHVVVQSAREEHHLASLGGHSYELPRKLGILQTVDSGNETTTEQIIERVLAKRHLFDTAEPPDGR